MGWEQATRSFGLEGEYDDSNPEIAKALEGAKSQALRINDGTRKAIAETVTAGTALGYAAQQLVDGVPGDDFLEIRDRVRESYANRPSQGPGFLGPRLAMP